MDFHLCKSRRGSNPDAVVNCNNNPGPGGINPNPETSPGACQDCSSPLSIHICPTTGGLFNVDIAANETVQGLRKLVSKKLGVAQDRISLLHKDKLLKDGSLTDYQLTDGSRVTLLPNVESGIMSAQPEVSVMQALENLSEGQVNDFLNGKSPLTLAMRLGNHMMFLQLQLSTVPPGSKRSHASPLRGKSSKQSAPVKLAVPPRTVSSATHNVCHNTLNLPTTLNPPSVMTPPPSPKSNNGTSSSQYTYPVTSLQVPSPQPPKDVTLDSANTPPPSPCYVQKAIPNLPTIQINDQTVPCIIEGDNTGQKTEGDITGRVRTCSQTSTGIKDNTCPVGAGVSFLDNSTIAQAKKSLSMKLKEFSQQASPEKTTECSTPGAVIESMQKLGRGVYSGTFSGTLNPALQDPEGRPKRNVSTIVHILNDLLGASPARTGHHARTRGLFQPNKDPTRSQEAGRLEQENQAIRGKVEHLQMMMEERKRRRQARCHTRAAPYPTQRHNTPNNLADQMMMDADSVSSLDSDASCDDMYDTPDQEMTHVTT